MNLTMLPIVIFTIIIAFIFTFTNGFQDAASIAATFIASRSATPRSGILFVAVFDFLGAILGGSAVAFTISSLLLLPPDEQLVIVVLSALLSAAAWNLLTWYQGLPSSSTYGLIGGLTGAGIAAAGVSSVNWGLNALLSPSPELDGMVKILLFMILSLVIGFAGGYLMRKTTTALLRGARRSANLRIVPVNWAAAAVMAFSSGANDAQKQMGVIALVLFAGGLSVEPVIPLWARVGCAVLLALGTLSGGWRTMATLGRRIFTIRPVHSLDSQVSTGASVALSTLAGAPISPTQVAISSILGVGAAENPLKVRWTVGKQIVITLLITIPATMIIAAAVYLIITRIPGG
jgi:PiT family inorganic phosphate transporter